MSQNKSERDQDEKESQKEVIDDLNQVDETHLSTHLDVSDCTSSPSRSPRDKRQRTELESTSSLDSPRDKPIMVAASPPKYVSMDEIMKAASGVSNLTLAHEIAVDSDFKIKQQEIPKDSVAHKVKEVMHRAFWDALQSKLNEDPPDLSHAIVLLQEAKEKLTDLLLPQHQRIKQQIDEVFDMELIEQKAEHGALDFHYYGSFVISLMAKLCAPARDEEIEKLKDIKEIVPLFKEVFSIIDLMKIDMANYTIQQIRPLIQQQSAQYERVKFDEFLKKQKESGVDGLQFTKSWIDRNYIILNEQHSQTVDQAAGAAAASTSQTQGTKITAMTIMNEAYLELLQWDHDNLVFPETVLMDESRFITLMQKFKWLSLVSSVLLVTYNTVGAPLSGMPGFKEKLRDQMAAILAGVPESKLADAMKNVAIQVNNDVHSCLTSHSFPPLDDVRQTSLKGQIESLADAGHMIRQIMKSRIFGFFRLVLSTQNPNSIQIPAGLSAVSSELSEACGQFVRLVNHNRNVFGPHYVDIIKDITNKSLANEVD